MKIEVQYPNGESHVVITGLTEEIPETVTFSNTAPEMSIPESDDVTTEPHEEISTVEATGPRPAPIENNKGAGWFSGTSWGS